MKFSRRHFLKGGLSFGAFGTGFINFLGNQTALADTIGSSDKKLIFIFQCGGNDSINTVIPRGDSAYNTTIRPTLFINESAAIDLGNSFAQLHPKMLPLMDIYNSTALNQAAGPGNLAIVHRVGYHEQSRSHFDSQDFWEKGVPGDTSVKRGMFYRQLAETIDLHDPANSFIAASLDGSALRGLQGDFPFPNFTSSDRFNFLGSEAKRTKFLGKAPSAPGAGDGKGILGAYGTMADSTAAHGGLVHGTGTAMSRTITTLAAAQNPPYTPENGAVYPSGSFGRHLEQAAMLLKRTPARILGLELDGWDTHTDQGAIDGAQANLLQTLAQGIQALHLDLQSQWDDVIIVTMTEFGRTSAENGSGGTDHAEAGAMFLAGGCVNGGVYNCDSTTWADNDMFSESERYLARKTDYRAVFGEIFTKHFGDTPEQLEKVIPGFGAAKALNPSDFDMTGIPLINS